MIHRQALDLVQRNEHPHEERLVLVLEGKGEAVDDGTKDLEQLSNAVVPFRLVDEVEEHVVDAAANWRTEIEELPVYPMQRGLEKVAFTRVL